MVLLVPQQSANLSKHLGNGEPPSLRRAALLPRLRPLPVCAYSPGLLPIYAMHMPALLPHGPQYYESEVKQRLLRYATSALLFSESRVNPQLISWNRVVLLHGCVWIEARPGAAAMHGCCFLCAVLPGWRLVQHSCKHGLRLAEAVHVASS